MKGLLFLVLFVVLVVLTAVLTELRERRRRQRSDSGGRLVSQLAAAADGLADSSAGHSSAAGCESCGIASVCDRNSGDDACTADDYFDDEELDVLRGRNPSTYSEAELAMIDEVRRSLMPEELDEWRAALARRGIRLPADGR